VKHERDKKEVRDMRDEEFEIPGSSTSDLYLSLVSPVPLFSPVSLCEV
jgi:hypothetical protein